MGAEARDLTGDDRCLLEIDASSVAAVVFSLRRGIDELEARAVLGESLERHRPSRRPEEYREDVAQLAVLLAKLEAHASPDPNPDGQVVTSGEHIYLLRGRRPVALVPVEPFEQLLSLAMRRSNTGHASGTEIADALAIASRRSREDLLACATDRACDTEPTPPSSSLEPSKLA